MYTTPWACCCITSVIKSSNLLQITTYVTWSHVKFDQNEMSVLIQVNGYWQCHKSCSKCPHLATHRSKTPMLLVSLHCQWCYGPCRNKPAASAASFRQCCAPTTDKLVAGCVVVGWNDARTPGGHRSRRIKVGIACWTICTMLHAWCAGAVSCCITFIE